MRLDEDEPLPTVLGEGDVLAQGADRFKHYATL